MHLVVGHKPFQLIFVVPFSELSELTAHKGELFARVGHLIGHKQTIACEFLLVAAPHFVQQRLFAVNHLIVGDGKDIILRKCVAKGEIQLVVVMLADDGIQRNVLVHIVGPAHIPFEVEAETSLIHRFGDSRPGGGLLGDHQNVAVRAEECAVQLLEEGDCL